jgi:hypothetical protein
MHRGKKSYAATEGRARRYVATERGANAARRVNEDFAATERYANKARHQNLRANKRHVSRISESKRALFEPGVP